MPRIERPKYLNQLINRIGNGMVKIITGLRRVGKSYFLGSIFYDYLISSGISKESIIEFDFSSEKDLLLINENYNELKKEHRKVDSTKFIKYILEKTVNDKQYYLLLDEVQELESFESVLNGFLSQKIFDIYVTGSNAKFLSKDIITEFRGRGDEIHLLPLAFSECWSFYDKDPKEALNKYMVYGGLPMVVLSKTDFDRRIYIEKQINETYIADIVERYGSKDEEDLKELLLFISSAISTFVNPKKLSARFKSIKHSLISEPTVATYIEHFEEIFLIKKALRYDVKRTTYISTPYKVYFEDVGIRNGVLSYRQIEPTHLMENVIFNELRFRGYSVDVGQIEVRDKIKDEQTGLEKEIKKYIETDFFANEGSNRFYIQSVYLIDGPEKREQETRSLLNIKDSFKKVIITYNNVFDGYDNNGIYYLDFYRFLIDENSLYK